MKNKENTEKSIQIHGDIKMTDDNIVNLDDFPDIDPDDINCNLCRQYNEDTGKCESNDWCSLKHGIKLKLFIPETEEDIREMEKHKDICINCRNRIKYGTRVCKECGLRVYGIELEL